MMQIVSSRGCAPAAAVDAAKLVSVEATEALAGAAATARPRPRKGAGIAGESDPDYEVSHALSDSQGHPQVSKHKPCKCGSLSPELGLLSASAICTTLAEPPCNTWQPGIAPGSISPSPPYYNPGISAGCPGACSLSAGPPCVACRACSPPPPWLRPTLAASPRAWAAGQGPRCCLLRPAWRSCCSPTTTTLHRRTGPPAALAAYSTARLAPSCRCGGSGCDVRALFIYAVGQGNGQ
jgi:hypothetical protein